MQFGVTSTTLIASGLQAVFRRAAEIGAEGLEVSYQTDNDAAALGKPGHVRTLSRLARTHGVAIPSLALLWLCRSASLTGAGPELDAARTAIRQALNVAARVGAGTVLVPFFGKNAIELEEELGRAADALLEMVDLAAEAGVVVAVESTLNFDQQQFLLNHLGDTGDVRICLDTGTALARKLEVATGIRDLGRDAIAQVHFKDVRIAEGKPPDFDVALGDGNVDFRAVAQSLRAVGYDGWVVLETPPGDDPIAAGKKNLQFARNALAAAAG